jgi:Family of unknown function (DUF6603)
VFDELTRAIRSALESASAQLPPLPGGGDPSLGNALDALDAAAAEINMAPDLDAWAQAVGHWHQALENVAAAAFDRLAAEIPVALSELAARVLMDRTPRTAATLVLAGVIFNAGTTDQPRWRVDYDALVDFITDPDTLINEQRWEDLFADVGHPHSGRLPAVLAGLLLMAPRAIIAIVDQNLSIAGPTPPAVRGDPMGVWGRFRTAAETWFSITLPLGDPAAPAGPNPADDYGWTSGLDPDLSASLIFRSDRRPSVGGEVTDFEMWVALGVDRDRWRYDLGSNWFVEIKPGITAGFGRDGVADQWNGAFAPLAQNSPLLPARPDDPVTIRLARENPGGAPDFQFGPPYDTRLVIADLEAFMRFREATPVFEIGAFVHGLAIVIAPRWFRSFGQPTDTFREGWKFSLDLDIAYGVGRGLTLNLASGLDVLWYVNKFIIGDDGETFNAKLHTIRFVGELLAQDGDFGGRIRFEFHVSCKIGPVKLVADGFGAWGGVWPFGTTGFGGYGRYWGLLPPTGVGLEIRFGDSVTGGGYIDFRDGPTERYAGLLMLKIVDTLDVTAFGIHERTPQGRTSFIAVLGVRFYPGIQLGYGFAITGVGGLVGINRRFDTDALRERLTSGAVGNVLFAPDPVRNAPIILGDAEALFPAADGVHVAGPTGRVSWIGLFHLDAGLLIEIATSPDAYGMTGVTKIALLGSAHATLDEEDEDLLHLQMDLAGFWDGPKKIVEFDSSLVHSRVFYVFLLTGDTAFRLSYGEQPYAMVTLGGFHPDFNPEPAQFPEMARIGVAYDLDQAIRVWLRLELYFAVTTNSIQTGALIEAGWKVGPINAIGFIGFDALIQFSPFKFSVAFTAGMRIRVGSVNVAGVHVKGTLSGPGPITISAEFCIDILFFDICWSGSFDLPPAASVPLPPLPNLLDLLASALSDPSSMSSSGGTGSSSSALVSQPQPDEAGAVIPPYGRIAWVQRVLPLDTELQRYNGQPLPAGPQAFQVTAPANVQTTEVRDHFAPGTFLNRTTSEQLSQATFERLPAGITFGFDMRSGDPVGRNVSIQSYLIPEQQPLVAVSVAFPVGVVAATGGRFARTSEFVRTAPALSVTNEAWVVHVPGAAAAPASSQTDAHTRAARTSGVALPANDLVAMGNV